MCMLTLSVLGPVVCSAEAGDVDLGGWRQRAVLARLLVARGQVVSAERLIDDIWGDDRPAQASTSLQAYISRLRRILEPERSTRTQPTTIRTTPPGYSLALDEHQVDAWQFESLLSTVDGLGPAASDVTRHTLHDALRLWRGDPFADFADEHWTRSEVGRLVELRLSALEASAIAELRLGRTMDAISDLESMVSLAPLRDTAWHLLALAHYRAGRQADALSVIARARHTLVQESGLDLLPALRELETAVLTQSATLSGGLLSETLFADAGVTSPTPQLGRAMAVISNDVRETRIRSADADDAFLGRGAELSVLGKAAERAATGHSRLCVIEGHSGTGKSRLLSEFATGLAQSGWRVGIGRCVEEAGAPAGFPWVEITETLSPADSRPNPHGRGPDETDQLRDAYLERYRMHRRTSDLLRSAATQGPLLLALDDVHNADSETVALLEHLTRELSNDRVLFVCAGRDNEGAAARETIASISTASRQLRIALGGLGVRDVGEILRAASPVALSDENIATIHRRTGGNVLFVRQFGSLLEASDVDGGNAAEAVMLLPAGIRDLVRVRVRRLPEAVQSLLAILTVFGTATDVDLLVETTGNDFEAVVDTIEVALQAGLVTEPQPGRIDFAHDVVKECIAADMSEARRSMLHARIATALATMRQSEASAIAHHYARAPRYAYAREAVVYSRIAAHDAERQFAFDTAAGLWRQALSALDATPEARLDDRLEISIDLIRTTALGGDAAEARDLRATALAEAAAIDDAVVTARIIVAYDVPSLWLNQEYGVVDAFLVATIESTLATLSPQDSVLRCRLLTCLALELEWSGTDRGRQAAHAASTMARELGDARLMASALNAQFRLSYLPGQLDERRGIATELLELTQQNGFVPLEVLARLMLAECSCADGRFDTADHHHAEARRMANLYHLPSPAAVSSWYDGLRELVRGDLASARRAYARAADVSARTRLWENEQAWVAGSEICLALEEGRIGDIVELCEVGSRLWPGPGMEAYAMALFASGHEADARALRADDPPREAAYLLSVTWRAFAGLMLNDRDRISWSYNALLPYVREIAGADTAVIAHGPVAQILGDLAARMDLMDKAESHYRVALEVAERSGIARWTNSARARLLLLHPAGDGMQANRK